MVAISFSKSRNPFSLSLLFVTFLLLATALPVQPQIHWNRGWGAGGSVGKRSPLTFITAGMKPRPQRLISAQCSGHIFESAARLSQQMQREIESILVCETEARLSMQVSEVNLEDTDNPSDSLPMWATSKKIDNLN